MSFSVKTTKTVEGNKNYQRAGKVDSQLMRLCWFGSVQNVVYVFIKIVLLNSRKKTKRWWWWRCVDVQRCSAETAEIDCLSPSWDVQREGSLDVKCASSFKTKRRRRTERERERVRDVTSWVNNRTGKRLMPRRKRGQMKEDWSFWRKGDRIIKRANRIIKKWKIILIKKLF